MALMIYTNFGETFLVETTDGLDHLVPDVVAAEGSEFIVVDLAAPVCAGFGHHAAANNEPQRVVIRASSIVAIAEA